MFNLLLFIAVLADIFQIQQLNFCGFAVIFAAGNQGILTKQSNWCLSLSSFYGDGLLSCNLLNQILC